MGYEESYGYLFDAHVRDKDAVMGTVMAIEMAEYYRLKGKTLIEQLETIYEKYGYFIEDTISYKFEGSEGLSKMDAIMEQFRNESKTLIDYTLKIDYLNDDTGLPKANVLKFYLDEKSWFVLRPSGTEPKLKVYFSICDADYKKALSKFEVYKDQILEKVKR
jgi:phosphoglucomutase